MLGNTASYVIIDPHLWKITGGNLMNANTPLNFAARGARYLKLHEQNDHVEIQNLLNELTSQLNILEKESNNALISFIEGLIERLKCLMKTNENGATKAFQYKEIIKSVLSDTAALTLGSQHHSNAVVHYRKAHEVRFKSLQELIRKLKLDAVVIKAWFTHSEYDEHTGLHTAHIVTDNSINAAIKGHCLFVGLPEKDKTPDNGNDLMKTDRFDSNKHYLIDGLQFE